MQLVSSLRWNTFAVEEPVAWARQPLVSVDPSVRVGWQRCGLGSVCDQHDHDGDECWHCRDLCGAGRNRHTDSDRTGRFDAGDCGPSSLLRRDSDSLHGYPSVSHGGIDERRNRRIQISARAGQPQLQSCVRGNNRETREVLPWPRHYRSTHQRSCQLLQQSRRAAITAAIA